MLSYYHISGIKVFQMTITVYCDYFEDIFRCPTKVVDIMTGLNIRMKMIKALITCIHQQTYLKVFPLIFPSPLRQ